MVGTLAALYVCPAGASAYVSDVSLSKVFSTSAPTADFAPCDTTGPGTQQALGGGAFLQPKDQPNWTLNQLIPVSDPQPGFAARSSVFDRRFGWQKTFAFCATTDAPAPGSAGGTYVKSVTIVRTESPAFVAGQSESTGTPLLKATCPPDKTLIGGGGNITPVDRRTSFDTMKPNGNNWLVGAHGVRWRLRADAICANLATASTASHYADEVEAVSATSDGPYPVRKTVRAECPAGKYIIGGGSEVIAEDPDDLPWLALNRSEPAASGTSAHRWVATAVTRDVYPLPEHTVGVWSVHAVAICARLDAPPGP